MPGIRRRSRQAGGVSPRDNRRLWAMVGLLAVVVVLMEVARQPAIWSRLLPEENPPVAEEGANRPAEAPASKPPSRPVNPNFLMGPLILLASLYFVWRIFSLRRRYWKRSQLKPRTRTQFRSPPPSDEMPVPVPEPPATPESESAPKTET